MKIKYKFVTETVEIEVDDEYGKLIKRMNTTEESDLRTIRNNETRLDAFNDYSSWLADEIYEERKEKAIVIGNVIDELSPKQQELIETLFGPDGLSAREYAKLEGVSAAAITKRKKRIIKNFKKVF